MYRNFVYENLLRLNVKVQTDFLFNQIVVKTVQCIAQFAWKRNANREADKAYYKQNTTIMTRSSIGQDSL